MCRVWEGGIVIVTVMGRRGVRVLLEESVLDKKVCRWEIWEHLLVLKGL